MLIDSSFLYLSLIFSRPAGISANRPIPAKPQHVVGSCYQQEDCSGESNREEKKKRRREEREKEEKVKEMVVQEGRLNCMCFLFEMLKGEKEGTEKWRDLQFLLSLC